MMRLARTGKRKALGLVLAAAMVVTATLAIGVPRMAKAATSGDITGRFTVGNEAPVLTENATLYNSGHTGRAYEMTPQTPYEIKVTVADTGTINRLKTVVAYVFHDTDGDDNWTTNTPSASTNNCFVMTCTVGGDNGTWAGNPSTDTSWAVNSDNCVQPVLIGGSGDFYFNFTPGMVATEASDWDVYVVVTDDSDQSDTYYDAGDYDMLWYGAIDVTTAEMVDWGTVTAGMDFNNAAAKKSVAVTYTSNGAWDSSVATDNWTDAGANTAALSADDTPATNEFAMKAYRSDALESAILVTSNEANCIIDNTGVQTGESGSPNLANTLYLKLGSPFVDATYSGTITFYIRNGS